MMPLCASRRRALCVIDPRLTCPAAGCTYPVCWAARRAWAQEYGVICLSGTSTFFTIDGADQPMFWPPDSLREALKPSGQLRARQPR